MKIASSFVLASLAVTLSSAPLLRGAEPPNFREVYDVIRSNLTQTSAQQLDRDAVEGLLSRLRPWVQLVTNAPAAETATNGPALSKVAVFYQHFGYLRVRKVEPGLAAAIRAGVARLNRTNHLDGLVLDLRYADGHDFAAAAEVANEFVTKAQPLLTWGNESIDATAKTNALTLPLMVLLNHETEGAPEALAAILRQVHAGMLIGSRTAGAAVSFKNFSLRNGQTLRLAVGPVRLADGQVLSKTGVKPDITVKVPSNEQRQFYEHPFRHIGSTGSIGRTNRAPRMNEAELVRIQEENLHPDSAVPPLPVVPVRPQITDPTLARALDLLKALHIIGIKRAS